MKGRLQINGRQTPLTLGASQAEDHFEPLTALVVAPGGSWGVATEIDDNQAISKAIANCKKVHQEPIGCGAQMVMVQAGWSLAVRCGSETIIAAEKSLAKAESMVAAREADLRANYVPDMPHCVRVLTVDPLGTTIAQKFGNSAER